jgi:hypothetical protein
MKAVCTSCRLEGLPGVIGERPPLSDPGEVSGICWSHKLRALTDTKPTAPIETNGTSDKPVRFIVVVRRSAPDLFGRLGEQFLADPRVRVVLDRRRGERRQRPQAIPDDRRQDSRRQTPDYWQDIRYHPVVIAPAHRSLDASATSTPSVTTTEASAMEVPSSLAENRHRIADWLRESDVIITRAIPSLFQECDAQRHRAEAAEERARQLAALVEELQGQVTTLQGEVDVLTRLRVEATERVEEWVTDVARLTNDVLVKIKPARAPQG